MDDVTTVSIQVTVVVSVIVRVTVDVIDMVVVLARNRRGFWKNWARKLVCPSARIVPATSTANSTKIGFIPFSNDERDSRLVPTEYESLVITIGRFIVGRPVPPEVSRRRRRRANATGSWCGRFCLRLLSKETNAARESRYRSRSQSL